MSRPFPMPTDEFTFGDSSCRPSGDGQENASSSGEHAIYRHYKHYRPIGELENFSGLYPRCKEASCLCEDEVCCKMKRAVAAERPFEAEPSEYALSSSYLQWARDLHELLDDHQGLELFKRFLANENCNIHILDFWLAVRGLKNNEYDPVQLEKAIKAIYKRFIKAFLVKPSPLTKEEIFKKIDNREKLDAAIFDKACMELEEAVLRTLYMNFLKSDLYLQYVQKMQNGPPSGESCRQSESSGSNSSTGSREMLDIMPTVPEECELNVNYKSYSCAPVILVPNDSYRHKLRGPSPDASKFNNSVHYVSSSKTRYSNSPYAKYSSYLPPSAQDSDQQSLSSGALTDDTMSDLDIGPLRVSKSHHHNYERSMRKNAHLNSESNELQPMIPRTQRPPVEKCMEASQNPVSFASRLIGKLTLLKQDSEKNEEANERLRNSLRKLEMEDESSNNLKGFERIPKQLLTATIKDKMEMFATDESDQSILDQHVSRIWNDSLHQSPSNVSPGQYSPPLRPRSPPIFERQKQHYMTGPVPLANSGLSSRHRPVDAHNNNTSQATSKIAAYTHHRHRRERDTYSTDSGTVKDMISDKEILERRSKEGGSNSRRLSLKKFSDSLSSGVDSGISVSDPAHPTVRDKVTSWLANEKYSCAHGSNSDKDSSTHHKKSSHSSQSNSSGTQSKQSKKQALAYMSARSSALDHNTGNSSSWTTNAQPTNIQQLQISSLPLQQQKQQLSGYNAVDITAQLVEAKKRLEDETRLKQSSGSRSKSGFNSKDKSLHAESSRGRSLLNKVPEFLEEKISVRKVNKRASITPASSTLTTSAGQPEHLASFASTGPSLTVPVIGGATAGELTTVCYSFPGDQFPYLSKLPGKNITFKQFKTVITKRGNYRYFFKTTNTELGSAGVVHEEITDDNALVPLWEGKVSCTIEPIPDN